MIDYGPFTLTDELIKVLQPHFEDQEGREPYIYPDSEGNPTVGIGHLLASACDAMKLPFQRKDGSAATQAEINSVYQLVQSTRRQSQLVQLPDPVIDSVFIVDLQDKAKILYRAVGAAPIIPQCAVVALYDIVFNVGGLLGFPHLRMAVLAGNWRKAAEESRRERIGERRNQAIRDLFLKAGQTAPLQA